MQRYSNRFGPARQPRYALARREPVRIPVRVGSAKPAGSPNRTADFGPPAPQEAPIDRLAGLQTRLMEAVDEIDSLKGQLASVSDELAEAQTEAAAYRDKYLRLAAEFESGKKRAEQRFALEAAEAQERLLLDLLPVADNLERALAHEAEQADPDALRKGVELTLRAFGDTMRRWGVRTIRPQGEPFDPAWHEAIALTPDEILPSGSVAHVEQTGYAVGDRLLRPAKVVVVR